MFIELGLALVAVFTFAYYNLAKILLKCGIVYNANPRSLSITKKGISIKVCGIGFSFWCRDIQTFF
jgi:hypothetical protein